MSNSTMLTSLAGTATVTTGNWDVTRINVNKGRHHRALVNFSSQHTETRRCVQTGVIENERKKKHHITTSLLEIDINIRITTLLLNLTCRKLAESS
jgi:ABC-type uncharacterized transport system ATPase component